MVLHHLCLDGQTISACAPFTQSLQNSVAAPAQLYNSSACAPPYTTCNVSKCIEQNHAGFAHFALLQLTEPCTRVQHHQGYHGAESVLQPAQMFCTAGAPMDQPLEAVLLGMLRVTPEGEMAEAVEQLTHVPGSATGCPDNLLVLGGQVLEMPPALTILPLECLSSNGIHQVS